MVLNLIVENLACGYGDRTVISNINLLVEAGDSGGGVAAPLAANIFKYLKDNYGK